MDKRSGKGAVARLVHAGARHGNPAFCWSSAIIVLARAVELHRITPEIARQVGPAGLVNADARGLCDSQREKRLPIIGRHCAARMLACTVEPEYQARTVGFRRPRRTAPGIRGRAALARYVVHGQVLRHRNGNSACALCHHAWHAQLRFDCAPRQEGGLRPRGTIRQVIRSPGSLAAESSGEF